MEEVCAFTAGKQVPFQGLLAGSDSAGNSESGLELAQCMPQLNRMMEQLSQTSTQIEQSIVEVCKSFQDIAQRARDNGQRVAGFLGSTSASDDRSFESLLQTCAATMVKLLDASAASGKVSKRAVERIQGIQNAAAQITKALGMLETIASANKILALNARIEAAHSGIHGAGFAAVAVELSLHTDRSREVTAQLSDLTDNLRRLATSTVTDLQKMQKEDDQRALVCRNEVDETLVDLRSAHGQMEQMLHAMKDEGKLLANDIGAAVRGLQFQDRVSQRIAHVVEDLAIVHERMSAHFGDAPNLPMKAVQAFSGQSMQEERAVYGVVGNESPGGDVDLF